MWRMDVPPLRCTLVASHDHSNLTTSEVGIRTLIHNALIHTIEIDCPGRFMHNDDSLQRDFADNKVEYLKGYTFNICPENSNASGYVTEKIFESIKSGCIPIYWGSYNNPEPDILNHEAILFFDRKNPQKLVAELTELISNPKKLGEFLARPRLKAGGEEVIINMLREVELRLKNIIAQR